MNGYYQPFSQYRKRKFEKPYRFPPRKTRWFYSWSKYICNGPLNWSHFKWPERSFGSIYENGSYYDH